MAETEKLAEHNPCEPGHMDNSASTAQFFGSLECCTLAINRHIRKEHDKLEMFLCMICGNGGRSNLAMNRHIRKKHENKKIF